jgi:arylsulfatase A-like enzyme
LPSHWDADAGERPPHFQNVKAGARNMKPEFGEPGESFEDFLRRSWRGTLACVSQIDHVFGLLLRFLKERGLDKNTIVILGSDHGAYHGHFGLLEKAPGICSDAVCRVPMIWKVPGVTPEGSVCSQLVENIDMAPTLAKLCGLPDFDSADGLDITPLLKNEDRAIHEIALTENVWSKSIRWKNWRFVHYSSRMFEEGDFGELYNLEEDPWESRNLYADPQHQDLVATLRRRLLEHLIETRRTVTTHVTVKNEPGRDCDPGARFTYPVCDDGTAPNPAQARNRQTLNKNYL